MKYSKTILLLLLFFTILQTKAQQNLYPKAAFDETMALNALAKGKSTIKGQAFMRVKSGGLLSIKSANKTIAKNIEVSLFPVTPSLLEYLELRKKRNAKKKIFVHMNPAAEKHRLTAITNSDGEFSFNNIKPGKYFLDAYIPWQENSTYDRSMGTENTHDKSTSYSQREYYTDGGNAYVTAMIEITNDGEVKVIKVTN